MNPHLDFAAHEPLAVAIMIGLLLSLSSGVRITLPLLAVNLLAYKHQIALPTDMAWLGSRQTLVILAVAFGAETIIHFIPAAGTWLKAAATPLAFGAGTLLMAVPLGDHNPLYQWTLAAALGGSAATLTHLGLTSARVISGPANLASLGVVGLIWNLGELFLSLLLAAMSALCVFFGWVVGLAALVALGAVIFALLVKGLVHLAKPESGSRVQAI